MFDGQLQMRSVSRTAISVELMVSPQLIADTDDVVTANAKARISLAEVRRKKSIMISDFWV